MCGHRHTHSSFVVDRRHNIALASFVSGTEWWLYILFYSTTEWWLYILLKMAYRLVDNFKLRDGDDQVSRVNKRHI